MHIPFEKAVSARLAKMLTSMCVRHTCIEDIHAGISPVSKTGDYSDVKVIDGDGREIPWNECSRITDPEMKGLMKQIVNRLYTFLLQGEDPRFNKQIAYFEQVAQPWDAPEVDPSLDCSKQSAVRPD